MIPTLRSLRDIGCKEYFKCSASQLFIDKNLEARQKTYPILTHLIANHPYY